MEEIRCDECGKRVPGYRTVNFGSEDEGYRTLCTPCFNAIVAQRMALDQFEETPFDPVRLTDVTGQSHEFHFRTQLFGTIVSLQAFELLRGYPSGYQFTVVDEPEVDLFSLFSRLVEKMQRGLSVQHLERHDRRWEIADHRIVRGHIEADETQGSNLPLMVIDGQEISWLELGRMLMSYEGWQFKLQIVDRSAQI